jgi:hypothetical protein
MTPLQRQAVQCVKEFGQPLRAHVLAAVLERSPIQASELLKAAYDEGQLTRTNIGSPRGGIQWGYEVWTPKN